MGQTVLILLAAVLFGGGSAIAFAQRSWPVACFLAGLTCLTLTLLRGPVTISF
jgi:hypothetical protein